MDDLDKARLGRQVDVKAFRTLYDLEADPWGLRRDEYVASHRACLDPILAQIWASGETELKILDVGCGPGAHARAILQGSWNVTAYYGIDISPVACKQFMDAIRSTGFHGEHGAWPFRGEVVLPYLTTLTPGRKLFNLVVLSEFFYYNHKRVWSQIVRDSLTLSRYIVMIEAGPLDRYMPEVEKRAVPVLLTKGVADPGVYGPGFTLHAQLFEGK